jgi:ATP-dependent protease ClpP protease subunit
MKKLISLILLGSLLLMPVIATADIKKIGHNEIMIDHVITEDSYSEFMEATAYVSNAHINLYIHSDGGDAYSTIGIVNRILDLKDRGCTFTTIVHAKAFSAGAYLFLMGDERVVYGGSSLMFHTMMQQVTKEQREGIRDFDRGNAVVIGMLERMDEYICDRFRKVVGDRMSEKAIQYFLYGTDEEDINGQYMSAETAYNVGVATQYKSANR